MTPPNGNGNGSAKAVSLQAISIIVTVAGIVLSIVGGLAFLFVNGAISGVQERTTENRIAIEKAADEFRTDIKDLNTLLRDHYATEDELERVRAALVALRADTVTLDAHQAILDRTTRLESTVGNITPVGDVLKDMQDQIKRLQNQLFMAGRPRTGADAGATAGELR